MTSSPDNSVTVKITGTVDPSLGASAATAKAQIEGIGNSAKISAAEMASALRQTGGNLSKITPEMVGLKEATEAAGSAGSVAEKGFQKAERAVSGAGSRAGTAAYEFRALFDELSSGRAYRTPSTLAIIGQRVYGLSTGALIAAGAVVGLAYGIAKLTLNAIQANTAISRLNLTARALGGVQLTSTQIGDLANKLAELPGVTRDAAAQIVNDIQNMGVKSAPAIEGLSFAANQYALAYGVKATDATKTFQKILQGQHITTASVLADFHGLTAAQAQHLAEVARGNDLNKTAATIMQLVAENTRTLGKDYADYVGVLGRGESNIGLEIAALEGLRSAQSVQDVENQTATDLWNDQTAAILGNVAALKGRADVGESGLHAAILLSSTSTHARIVSLKSDIKELQDELADPNATNEMKANFRSAIEDRQRELKSLQNKSSFGGTGFSNAGAQEIAQAREKVSELNAIEGLGGQERLAKTKAIWNDVLASDKLNAAQRLQVQKSLNDAIAHANHQTARDSERIARDEANTEVELARIAHQKRRDELDQEVAAGRLSKRQEIAILVDYLQKIEALQLDAINKEESGYDKDSVAYARAEDRKKVIAAQANAQIAQLNRDAARNSAKEWGTALGTIESAEDRVVQGLFSRTQTVRQVMFSIIEEISKKWLTAGLHELTQHIFIETSKTQATIAGETARVAAKTAGAKAGGAVDVATGSAQILNDAYKAAAGAYQAVVGIPYVGPILAPIAAATAFGAVAAFDTLTSFDVGTNYVPRDMAAVVHRGERIIPAADNAEIIKAVTINNGTSGDSRSAPASGSHGAPIGLSVQTMDARSFLNFLNNPVTGRILARRVADLMTTNPSYRPAF